MPWGDDDLHSGGSEMLPAEQKLAPLPSGERPQQEYVLGFRPYFPCLKVQEATVVCRISEKQSDPPEGLMASCVIATNTSQPSRNAISLSTAPPV